MSKINPTEAAVFAILREAQQADLAPLTHTVLHKLVYLTDLYVAEESDGRTFTSVRWLFKQFGPFSPALAESIDAMAGRGDILVESGSGNEDARLYKVKRGLGTSFRDIGLAATVALRLAADLKRFARDLPGLLDYVYFRTAPMADARPGSTLRFDMCERSDFRLFKPIAMKPIPEKRLKEARAKLRSLSEARDREQQRFTIGPFDDAYYASLAALEGEPLPVGLTGQAKIASD